MLCPDYCSTLPAEWAHIFRPYGLKVFLSVNFSSPQILGGLPTSDPLDAGVANTGTDRNWTGHPLTQANWFVFGRLAWDHRLSSEELLREWIAMTFTSDERFAGPPGSMMMESREAVVNYMRPLERPVHDLDELMSR